MNERRRPFRRGRGPRAQTPPGELPSEPNPYADEPAAGGRPATTTDAPAATGEAADTPPRRPVAPRGGGEERDGRAEQEPVSERVERPERGERPTRADGDGEDAPDGGDRGERGDRGDRGPRPGAPTAGPGNGADRGGDRGDRGGERGGPQQNGRRDRNRRGRDRGRDRGRNRERPRHEERPAPAAVAADGEETGWFDTGRDGGYIRRARASYLADPTDPFIPMHLVRQLGLRRGDGLRASVGRDGRGRTTVVDVLEVNGADPALALRRPEFTTLTHIYPERRLTLETGRSAKGGPELIRRAIDLIAPIGYGQRALIVAPARAGKTTLMHAVTEGIAINHPNAVLLILLVDERPEEVSEAISWGTGEVIASSFDQPAQRHCEVTEMTLERARRLVETGKDVVIVLDSITRMARAFNTAERGTGRTMSGGLDTSAMAKPKAFFGSARAVAPSAGGGSLTIIATALVETGSRMDDVIFEEFKGTGNSEIKLDRGLAEKRIYPAFDIAASGTRREEKLFKPEQLDAVFTLRRGLQQMPPSAAMEWLIKRIAATPGNDQLLGGL